MLELSLITVAIGLIVAILIYRYFTRHYFYFADKPIPFLKPAFAVGNLGPLLMKKRDIFEHFKTVYDSFPDARIFGFFNMADPVYMVRDPAMIKRIAVKDFDHFVDHTGMTDQDQMENSHMLVMNTLLSLRGQKWRDMRATLSPAFTGAKMRQMFVLIAECGLGMVEFYKGKIATEGPQVVELKDMFSRFTNDVIASTAFGIKVDSFKDENNAIFALGKAIMERRGLEQNLKVIGYTISPKLMVKMNIDFLSKDHDRFFRETVLDTMKTRQEKNIFRPDMIELLIQAKKGSLQHSAESQSTATVEGFATVEESQVGRRSHNRVWSDNELIAQALVFFSAGFEPTASALSFAAYELTKNVDVQAKLYQEILNTEQSLEGKPLSYKKLQSMQYLDMVVSETLRLWPVGTLVDRLCVKDYLYDDGQGCRFTIEKGRTVMMSIIGMHRDARFYPEPEKFDPERFSEENRRNINVDAYLPFGIGPRNCIGSRFALMEVKTILYYMLLNFSFEVHEKTQIPLKLQKTPSRIAAENGIWVELRPRVNKE